MLLLGMPKRQQVIRCRRCKEQLWPPMMLMILLSLFQSSVLQLAIAAPLPEISPKTSERSPTSSSHNQLLGQKDQDLEDEKNLNNRIWNHSSNSEIWKPTLAFNSSSALLTVSDSASNSVATQTNPRNPIKYPPSFSRKIKVLAFILGCCCLVAIIVNFINLHSDYEELQEFYIGYMGRKMLIQERRLTSRTYLNLLRREHQLTIENDQFMEITEAFQQQESSANAVTSATAAATAAVVAAATCLNKTPVHRSGSNEPKRSPNCNGHASSGLQVYRDGEISFIPLQERGIIIHDGIVMEATTTFSNSRGCSGTSVPAPVGCGIETETTPRCPAVTVATTSTRRKIPSSTATMTLTTHSRRYRELMTAAAASPHKKIPNMSVIVMQQPMPTAPVAPARPEVIDNGSEEWLLPLLAKEFIEDHDVEWRNLDYMTDVGPPPTSFWLFVCQYDCKVFPARMTEREAERRKNLLNQFRLWKLLKRKHWNIVVTERAKKEMADREQDHMRR